MRRSSFIGLVSAALVACGVFIGGCAKDAPPAPPGTPNGNGGEGGSAPLGSGGRGNAQGGVSGGGGSRAEGTGGSGSGGRAPDATAGESGSPDVAAPTEVGRDLPTTADAKATVVVFLIDGLQADAAKTAAANGATNLKFVIDNGVTVLDAHSTSSAARTTLPNSTALPWGNATSGNVAVHTGTHLFEAGPEGMDDIFVAGRAAGMKSVFSGGDNNYAGLMTADFSYASTAATDQVIVQNAINHLKNDKVRILRIHLQRLRDDWSGPAGKTDPTSAYVRHIVANDAVIGMLFDALKAEGVWEKTLLIVTADHGMGQSTGSNHQPAVRSSWDIFMGFYGPGVKKGGTIPYAELPDVAVTAAKFLGLPPLKGHTGAAINIPVKGATGIALDNIYVGAPDEIAHPRYVEKYLGLNTFPMSGDDYQHYRAGMLTLIK